MEKVFLASTNHFLYIFSRLLSLKAFFGLVEMYFWGNPSFQLLEKDFTSNENRPLYLRTFFYYQKLSPIWVETNFLTIELILAGGKPFSGNWKPFISIVSDFSRSPWSQLVETHFSVQKKKFFIQSFRSCWWKPLFKL